MEQIFRFLNMIKSYGFKDCLVLSPSEGPFLSLLKEMGVSYKVVPFKFNMATYNKNFFKFYIISC